MGVSPLISSSRMRREGWFLDLALVSLPFGKRADSSACLQPHSWQRKSPAEQAAVRVAREEAEKTKGAVQKIGA
jgi:hypothetical protein